MYLTYEEYQNMGGTLEEAAFNSFEFEAECIINWYTFDRLKYDEDYPRELKMCMFEIIRLLQAKAELLFPTGTDVIQPAQGAISSQSNDGVSISYAVLSASNMLSSYKSEIDHIIRRALTGTVNSLGHKLLYRGVYPGE